MKALLARLSSMPPLSRDKADTLLLLGSALLVLAPHVAHLPGWVSAVCLLTLLWRAAITLQGKRMPSAVLLLPLAAIAMVGVSYTYQTLLGRDAGVAMLVLLVAFKMLEMHARRDLFVVVFLCFFLVLTNFFYEQGIGTALLMTLSVLALLAAQMSFQFSGAVPPLRQRFMMSARILGLAMPLAAGLFFLFPRIEGPLWGMPGDADSARSGLSETMAPGTMSQLARSSEPAFRVRFDAAPPSQEQLYWRGPVLGDYDGRTWTRVRRATGPNPAPSPLALSVSGKPVGYEVTLEPQPGQSRWLFALEMPQRLPALDGNLAQVSDEAELTSTLPVAARLRYRIESFTDYRLQAAGLPGDAGQWLQLPGNSNPRALMAGMALRAEPDPRVRVRAVLSSFRREPFVYTLNPPLLGRHAVDDFLYGSRAGFCEHFAGSFVFLMRAAGVPARVVTGYQGGELNPIDGYVTVRQSDAHAWAEVWLARRGWVRVDPTAAVAPERVRRGLMEAIAPPAPFSLEGLGRLMRFDAGSNPWLAQMRYAVGALNNGWNQWVLNYSPQRQRGLIERMGASLLDWRLPLALVIPASLLLLLRALRRRKEIDPIDALYSALCARLARMGLPRSPDASPSVYAAQVAAAARAGRLSPPVAAAAADFLAAYGAWRYAPRSGHEHPAPTLKRLLSQVR